MRPDRQLLRGQPSRRPRAVPAARAGSSIVVRSPGSRPSQTAWIARRSSLPERVFGSTLTKCTRAGRASAPSCVVDRLHDVAFEPQARRRHRRARAASLRDDEGHRDLALQRIGHADHRDLGDVRMARDALLDLARAEPVAGDVDDVVGAAEDEVVAVGVADAPVEGVVDAAGPGCCPSRSRTKRASSRHTVCMQPGGIGPSITTTPLRFGSTMSCAGRLVDQLDVVAVHRHARAAELARRRLDAVGDRQDRPAALGLPVVVDDRLAERLGDPRRGRLVERLAGQEQRAQRRQVVTRAGTPGPASSARASRSAR